MDKKWRVENQQGKWRVVVTRDLPGRRWLDILIKAGCRVDIGPTKSNWSDAEIIGAIGPHCDGVIGQLVQVWGASLFAALKKAGGRVYSNYAVGYNNIDLAAATKNSIPVGNTPGVLTETTAELAAALTLAAARRIGEAERYIRDGRFIAWRPDLMLGRLLRGKTLGVVGAGRIGAAYARMLMQGHHMNLIYYNRSPNHALEADVVAFNDYLEKTEQPSVLCQRAQSIEELLAQADVVSLHCPLDASTTHLINAKRLRIMKKNAVLINTTRGPVIDEAALVEHLKSHPDFRAGLDVFEKEPALSPGLADLENVVLVPHIGSATRYAREGMATLAASNVAAVLNEYPIWDDLDMTPFLDDEPPKAVPSILNAKDLGLGCYGGK